MPPISVVTGGCGFIGSHVVDRLVKEGHEVICIDDESAECNEIFYKNNKATYLKESITNYEAIKGALKGATNVFHLAAESHRRPVRQMSLEPAISFKQPRKTMCPA
jgi:UDP-glucose 4-epimerase